MRPLADISSFHAHVYFAGEAQAAAAKRLREAVAERFQVRLGTWHDRAVGPHDRAMFQIAFGTDQFGTLVPWLMLNHQGLSILVHPNSGFPRRDHLHDRIWIGDPLALHEDVLPEREAVAEPAPAPNTRPVFQP